MVLQSIKNDYCIATQERNSGIAEDIQRPSTQTTSICCQAPDYSSMKGKTLPYFCFQVYRDTEAKLQYSPPVGRGEPKASGPILLYAEC